MLHPLEVQTLKAILDGGVAAGCKCGEDDVPEPPPKIDALIDQRLSFADNKKVVREWLKRHKYTPSVKSELIAENELTTNLSKELREQIEKREAARYAEVADKKKKICGELVRRRDEAMKEVDAFNPYCKNVTYSTLFSAMNGKQGSQKTHAVNKGKQGIGKSRGTTELAQKLDLPDAVYISGYLTPKKLYMTLKENYANLIILDESELIMNDPMALFILRSALYGGKVSWLTSRGDVCDSFEFKGTIIANMNHFGLNEAEAAPLFDRTLFNDNDLDNHQIMEKIRSKDTYKPNEEIWSLIRDRVTVARADGLSELEDFESKQVMDFIFDVAGKATIFNKSLSTRAHARCMLVARCLKTMYGPLTGSSKLLFEELAKPYISIDDADDVCVKSLRMKPNLSRKELAEVVAQSKNISERQATRLIKAAIENGALEEVNRTHVRIAGSAPVVATDVQAVPAP